MLAPLIDGMITRNIARRFTAAQALRFFEDLYLQTTDEMLNFDPEWHIAQDMVFDDIRADRLRNLPDVFVRAKLVSPARTQTPTANKTATSYTQERLVLLHRHVGQTSLPIDQEGHALTQLLDTICAIRH
jgi:hypothetical protein